MRRPVESTVATPAKSSTAARSVTGSSACGDGALGGTEAAGTLPWGALAAQLAVVGRGWPVLASEGPWNALSPILGGGGFFGSVGLAGLAVELWRFGGVRRVGKACGCGRACCRRCSRCARSMALKRASLKKSELAKCSAESKRKMAMPRSCCEWWICADEGVRGGARACVRESAHARARLGVCGCLCGCKHACA
eukprot:341153-Pleurochrysis_carterae.AAC.2